MADEKNQRRKYVVLDPYQCPNRKCWHKKDEEVELLPCEAQFLLLSGKVAEKVAVPKKKGDS